MGLTKYLKAAFAYRWNLLALFGGLGFAAVSGRFDIVAPLVIAAEIAYLGLLGTHPKFQHYVDAQEAKATRTPDVRPAVDPEQTVRRILAALPRPATQRFEALRLRCAELRRIAADLRDPNRVGTPPTLEEMQLAGLDRLLWIYLRLLFTRHSLEQFLARTDSAQIEADIQRLRERLAKTPADTPDPQQQKLRKVLDDNLATSLSRMENLKSAKENCEFVQLELDRLENKINSLSESAINSHDADFITRQVDQVVSGMMHTEQTMTELQFVTGLAAAPETVPEMLQRPPVQIRQ